MYCSSDIACYVYMFISLSYGVLGHLHCRNPQDFYPLHFFHPVGALREMCLIHMNIHYLDTTNEMKFLELFYIEGNISKEAWQQPKFAVCVVV